MFFVNTPSKVKFYTKSL